MRKRCFRYFGGLLNMQEKWLNRMAARGYRLVGVGKISYTFESCTPDSFVYCVDFIAYKSRSEAADYKSFLEEMGYRSFYKNMNLNWSLIKLRWRPWANPGGQLATQLTTYNRELLIVEKQNDGKGFELHTGLADQKCYYRRLQAPYFMLFVMVVLGGLKTMQWPCYVAAALLLLPLACYQYSIFQIKREARLREW